MILRAISLLILISYSVQLQLKAQEIEGVKTNFSNSIVYFLDPECKLCISKAYDIKETISKYIQLPDLKFYIVFHKDTHYRKSKKYFKKLKINSSSLNYIYDKKNLFVCRFDVKITPTVYLVNKNSDIIYQGALDDKDVSVEISKYEKNYNYIERALEEYLNKNDVSIPKTKSIGCIFR